MIDIGDYCRQVEAHLTRVNGGHLVRIVGPGFSLVRQRADEGVPLSAVFRGIEQKAERHKAGASKRPLRIEFCEADVREVYDAWRRAIGVAPASVEGGDGTSMPEADRGSGSARRSTTRDLDRAVERLVAVAGRLELPEALREGVNGVLDQVLAIRDQLKGARGAARDAALAPLAEIDRTMLILARRAVPEAVMADIRSEAERDLLAFRDRLSVEAWQQAVDVTIDRGVRAHFALPDLASL